MRFYRTTRRHVSEDDALYYTFDTKIVRLMPFGEIIYGGYGCQYESRKYDVWVEFSVLMQTARVFTTLP
jgi:hypothetical protein